MENILKRFKWRIKDFVLKWPKYFDVKGSNIS